MKKGDDSISYDGEEQPGSPELPNEDDSEALPEEEGEGPEEGEEGENGAADEEEAPEQEEDDDIEECVEEQEVEYEELGPEGLEDGVEEFSNVKYLDSAQMLTSQLALSDKEIESMRQDAKRRRTFIVSATIGHSFFTSRMMTKKIRKETKKKRQTDENFNPKIAEI